MRRVANALCFALAFAVPACVAAVAYPFNHGRAAPPFIDANPGFPLFCFYAFIAGATGGAVYALTLAHRHRDASMVRSVFSGMGTLVISSLSAFLLVLLSGTDLRWLGGFVLLAALIGCAFACVFLVGNGGRTHFKH